MKTLTRWHLSAMAILLTFFLYGNVVWCQSDATQNQDLEYTLQLKVAPEGRPSFQIHFETRETFAETCSLEVQRLRVRTAPLSNVIGIPSPMLGQVSFSTTLNDETQCEPRPGHQSGFVEISLQRGDGVSVDGGFYDLFIDDNHYGMLEISEGGKVLLIVFDSGMSH
jgi:hypothetical protein